MRCLDVAARPVMAAAALVVAGLLAPSAGHADEAALKALVEQAKKEPQTVDGRVTLALIPIVEKANALFNKHFGLDKKINIVEGVDNTFTTQLMATLDLGGKAGLGFYSTNGGDMPGFVNGNYTYKLDNWKEVLAEVNPRVKSGAVKPEAISPAGFAGHAYAHSNRIKGIGYNTTLAKQADLPQTYAEMADPKYKGQFGIEPWTSHWLAYGFNYYPDRMDEALGIFDAIGKNTYVVSRSHQLVPRIALGEFKFMTLNAEVVADFLEKNPGAPLDFYFMKDQALVETTMIFVPRNGPAPATATLWAMYLSHPDAQALRGRNAPNVMYGELESDAYMLKQLANSKLWDWQDSPETIAYWQWLNSDAAKDFQEKLAKAISQRK